MRTRIATVALLGALTAACSGSSSGGSTSQPAPSPTYKFEGAFRLAEVLQDRSYATNETCSTDPYVAFPGVVITKGASVLCDIHQPRVLLLAKPAVDEQSIEATSVGHAHGSPEWTVFLQISPSAAKAASVLTGSRYVVVYDGMVLSRQSVGLSGLAAGLVQVTGLSKANARRMAADLNPS